MSLSNVILVAVVMGIDWALSVKVAGIADTDVRERSAWLLSGLIVSAIISFITLITIYLATIMGRDIAKGVAPAPLWLTLAATILTSWHYIFSGFAKGNGQLNISTLKDQFIFPGSLAILVVIAFSFGEATILGWAVSNLVSAVLAFLFILWSMRSYILADWSRFSRSRFYQTAVQSVPLGLTTVIESVLVNLPILLGSSFLVQSEIGVVAAVMRFSFIIQFLWVVIGPLVAGPLSHRWSMGNLKAFDDLVQKTATLGLKWALITGVALFILRQEALRLFGGDFVAHWGFWAFLLTGFLVHSWLGVYRLVLSVFNLSSQMTAVYFIGLTAGALTIISLRKFGILSLGAGWLASFIVLDFGVWVLASVKRKVVPLSNGAGYELLFLLLFALICLLLAKWLNQGSFVVAVVWLIVAGGFAFLRELKVVKSLLALKN